MPRFTLTVSAELENAARVEAAAPESHAWRVRLACGSCREPAAAFSVVSATDAVDLPNGRGTANLVQKCKLCGESWTLDVSPVKGAALTADAPAAVLVELEVRGAAPVEWAAGDGWTVRGVSDEAVFTGIDLTEDLCEYDEGAEVSVEVRKVAGAFALSAKK